MDPKDKDNVEELTSEVKDNAEEIVSTTMEEVPDDVAEVKETIVEETIAAEEIVVEEPIIAEEIVAEEPITAEEIVAEEPITAEEIVAEEPITADNQTEGEQLGSFTEKLVPILSKAEGGIRKGVSSAKDFAKKTNEEHLSPMLDKAKSQIDIASEKTGKKIPVKLIGIAAGALVLILVLIILLSGGGNSSEKIALKFTEAMIHLDIKTIEKCVEPRVWKYIEKESYLDELDEYAEEIKELLNTIKLSYKVIDQEELDEYDLEDINDHFAYRLNRERYDAKSGISYTINVTGKYFGQRFDENLEVVVIKVGGKWYVAAADGSYVDDLIRFGW